MFVVGTLVNMTYIVIQQSNRLVTEEELTEQQEKELTDMIKLTPNIDIIKLWLIGHGHKLIKDMEMETKNTTILNINMNDLEQDVKSILTAIEDLFVNS